jgi:hypothetical protein
LLDRCRRRGSDTGGDDAAESPLYRRVVKLGRERRRVDSAAAAASASSRGLVHPVHELQRSAGNAAVTAFLQRDLPLAPSGPNLNVRPDFVEKRDKETQRKITAYLNAEKPRIQGRIVSGWSMPELVDLIRTQVPESVGIGPERVAQILRGWSTELSIPEHRKPGDAAGAESELIAMIKNSFSKIPTSVSVKKSGMFVKVSLSGIETGLGTADGDKVSVESPYGQDVGVNVVVGKTHFAAKVEPGAGGEPTHWEVNLSFPGDDPMPLMGSLGQLFGGASSSIGAAAADVRAGRATVGSLKGQWAPVKDAVSAVSTIADHEVVSLGLKVEGNGPAVTATATVTVTF